MVTALKQLATHTRRRKLAYGLQGCIEHIEKGQSLASSMENYPDDFFPLIVSIIKIGGSSGRLSESFGHIHKYLEFESNNMKEINSSFRYPIFVLTSMAIAILNIFVIPTFAHFYTNATVTLPWQTRFLIGLSNIFVHDGINILIALIIGAYFFFRYLRTVEGQFRWSHLQLQTPLFGKLLRRLILIRFRNRLPLF